MFKWFTQIGDRRNKLMLFFMVFFSILLIRLAFLTIVQGDEFRKLSENNRLKKIPITAKRGEIYDRNGKLLAANIPAFTVQFLNSNITRSELNKVALKTINILDGEKEKHILFPIQKNDSGLYYVFDKEKDIWLKENGFSTNSTPKEVFSYYRRKEQIASDLSDNEAYKILILKGVIVPVSILKDKFWFDVDKSNFLSRYGVEGTASAEKAFDEIKKIDKLELSKGYTEDEMIKILAVVDALVIKGYLKYDPIRIADNVKKETAILLEEMSIELQGIDIAVEPIRLYPLNNLASHIIGYMGKISGEGEIEKYVKEYGYRDSQLIGKVGIEGRYELDLKGENGYKYVEVDVYGRIVNSSENGNLKGEDSKAGKDVVLSIDADLQKNLRNYLKQAIEKISVGGVYKSKWGNFNYYKTFSNAASGAAVVLNVKTGKVMAMANYPDYDLNLFSTGITMENWSKLEPKNPKDSLSPRPLYNTATMTAIQPGSTFKMVTGFAALIKGMDPYKYVNDAGYIELGGHKYGCWIWTEQRGHHGLVNLMRALEVSCNYYFFDVINGWDYDKKTSLGFQMSTDDLIKFTKLFGLGKKTGIEIQESSGSLPNAENKKAMILNNLRSRLKQYASDYFTTKIYGDVDVLNEKIDMILSWADLNLNRTQLIDKLKSSKIVSGNFSPDRLADIIKYDYFNMMQFNEGDKMNLAIGQGDHQYTVIQMARFIAAIANGGYVNEVSVVESIGGKPIVKNKDVKSIDENGNLKYIKQGMLQATSGPNGTTKSVFGNFPIKVGGKTGTAQNQASIPPLDEKGYLKNHLSQINSKLTWSGVVSKSKEILKIRSKQIALLQKQVEEAKETSVKEKLQKEINSFLSSEYLSDESALRSAIIELSNYKVTSLDINRFRKTYDDYAWFVSFAPFDNPEIAVVVMIPQGGEGHFTAPVARDIIADYLKLKSDGSRANTDLSPGNVPAHGD